MNITEFSNKVFDNSETTIIYILAISIALMLFGYTYQGIQSLLTY